ncbi:PREDICTED: uncharacterized protein LOC104766223 [Camelina sativa]|uniref:Uncharacterized protein LOC104766223 n=1 Tax=Camelina sativa TaxID=90675 RepID=A0ABM0XN32_CAMSA|nr:PREDICTED: uncharacterized protein LOC104766223 [Camelina sativa]XP_019096762.1 PREDICTED: uncharacterized protein LOC104766223 [Camelina sativa]
MSNVKSMMCTTLTRSMPAIAFFGRMAFAFVFLISAIQEYADHFGDGGPLEKTVGPAVNAMTKYGSKALTFYTGMQVVAFDVRLLEFSLISAKATAALCFIFGQSIPAYFLLVTQMLSTVVPFPTNLNDFTQNLTLIGALLYYIGLKHTIDNLDQTEKNKEKETEEDDKASTSKAKEKAN